MRKFYQKILKEKFHNHLIKYVMKLGYTNDKMADILVMDSRSYHDLHKGDNSCSSLTLTLFLIYCCEDPIEFLKELKCGYEERAYNEFAQEAVSYRTKLPVKEIYLYEKEDSIYPLCPRCKETIDRDYVKYCSCCGQRLQWTDWTKAPITKTLKNT